MERKQEVAIAALITAPNLDEAATIIGINRTTILRWLDDEGFNAAYMRARREIVRQAIAQVQNKMGRAIEAWVAVLDDPHAPSNAKVSAGRCLFEFGMKGLEVEDILVRLQKVEAQLELPFTQMAEVA
jgi:hypothetical protein